MPWDGSEFKFEIDETTKLLIAARGMVERGWCQNKIAIGGQVCAVGGLTRIAKTAAALFDAMGRLERVVGGDIATWNDTKGRTKEEVLAAYDAAIAASV